MSASRVSARIEDLSRPPEPSSPLPRSTWSPTPRARATWASARMLTTAARSLARRPSARSGCRWYSASVTTRLSTASPRNSSRSLVGRFPCSYAYDRCVRARSSRLGAIRTPRASTSASALEEPCGATTGVGSAPRSEVLDPAALVLEVERGAGRVRDDAGLVRPRVGHLAALHPGGQGRGRRLPLGAAGPRVAARHLALGDGHVTSPQARTRRGR